MKKGFTLFEFIIVISILLILFTVVLVALNPFGKIRKSRNARRWGDVNNISTAVQTYITDNSKVPEGLDNTVKQIGSASTGCSSNCSGASDECLDLSDILQSRLSYMPFDIQADEQRTGYSIVRDENEILTVRACLAEDEVEIWLAR
jgi:prepilin-type N-terminal cleavage/methylation domain-containing protein